MECYAVAFCRTLGTICCYAFECLKNGESVTLSFIFCRQVNPQRLAHSLCSSFSLMLCPLTFLGHFSHPNVYLPAGILTLSLNMKIYTDLTWGSNTHFSRSTHIHIQRPTTLQDCAAHPPRQPFDLVNQTGYVLLGERWLSPALCTPPSPPSDKVCVPKI